MNSQVASTVAVPETATVRVQADANSAGANPGTSERSHSVGAIKANPIPLSRGGMASKLAAARIATDAGENVIIADGRATGILGRVLAGEGVGTLILAKGPTVAAKKRWIGRATRPRGQIWIDDGAVQAVCKEGSSLLAVGIVSVHGEFRKGDIVALCHLSGREFARGLTNYPSHDIERITGQPTSEIASILGHHPYDEVIHRDNLALAE